MTNSVKGETLQYMHHLNLGATRDSTRTAQAMLLVCNSTHSFNGKSYQLHKYPQHTGPKQATITTRNERRKTPAGH